MGGERFHRRDIGGVRAKSPLKLIAREMSRGAITAGDPLERIPQSVSIASPQQHTDLHALVRIGRPEHP
jgi:hypothetical protein